MLRSPLTPAAVAAGLALVLPAPAVSLPAVSVPAAVPGAPVLLVVSVLLAVGVVAGAGWDGHRRTVRALRSGAVTADAGVSLATLPALAWSVPALLVPAVSAGPDPATAPPALLSGPVLLPGAAAVLTVVAIAVRCPGRAPRTGPESDRIGTTRGWLRLGSGRGPERATPDGAADRWSARLVPAVALTALAVTGFRVGAGEPWTSAVPAGLAVLLGACPVALLAAVPAAVRAADRAGGPDVRLPLPAAPARLDPVGWTDPTGEPWPAGRVDTVALAGSDVLTGAAPGPITVHPARGEDPATVLRLAGSVAAAARSGSDLAPLARALAHAADAAPGDLPEVAEADEQPGLGLSGLVAELVSVPARTGGRPDGGAGPAGAALELADRTRATVVAHAVLLGSPCWLLEHGIGLPAGLAADRERAEADGRAVVAVAWDGTARAVLALTRAPHPDAAAGVTALRSAGAEPVLLTPDEYGAARALAAAAGLDPADPDAVRPALDPAGRAAAVAGLRVRGRTVAVAADPGTDAAALAGADLAVELVAPGPGPDPDGPVPVEVGGSARITVRGGPGEVAVALVLARRARSHARTGIRGAVGVAVVGTVAAVAGAPGPLVAALPVLGAVAIRARRLRVRT